MDTNRTDGWWVGKIWYTKCLLCSSCNLRPPEGIQTDCRKNYMIATGSGKLAQTIRQKRSFVSVLPMLVYQNHPHLFPRISRFYFSKHPKHIGNLSFPKSKMCKYLHIYFIAKWLCWPFHFRVKMHYTFIVREKVLHTALHFQPPKWI